jgi:hypothetical protein
MGLFVGCWLRGRLFRVQEVAAESIVHPPALDTFQRWGTTQITSRWSCKTLLPLYYRAININLQLLIVQIGLAYKSRCINSNKNTFTPWRFTRSLSQCAHTEFLAIARRPLFVLHFVRPKRAPGIIYTVSCAVKLFQPARRLQWATQDLGPRRHGK